MRRRLGPRRAVIGRNQVRLRATPDVERCRAITQVLAKVSQLTGFLKLSDWRKALKQRASVGAQLCSVAVLLVELLDIHETVGVLEQSFRIGGVFRIQRSAD